MRSDFGTYLAVVVPALYVVCLFFVVFYAACLNNTVLTYLVLGAYASPAIAIGYKVWKERNANSWRMLFEPNAIDNDRALEEYVEIIERARARRSAEN